MPSIPIVKIDGKYYPVDQLVDKGVYAKTTTKLYRFFDTKPEFQVAKGGYVGKVYSWISRTDGIWLMFETNSVQIREKYPTGVYYVKASDISDDALKEQGTKTSEQLKEKEEEEQKSTTDKVLGTVKTIALGGVGIYAVTKLIGSFLSGGNKN